MKRYVVFGGQFRLGGWRDFRTSRATRGSALTYALTAGKDWSWWHIVDTKTGRWIDESANHNRDFQSQLEPVL